ncbi:MAG: hypothetical protein NT031_06625 [Planctomycetota bacterium]|nr:hypothetical protein [Planctomycetota bacterium]
MKRTAVLLGVALSISVLALVAPPAAAHVTLGVGNNALLGGDLTDPTDSLIPVPDCGGGSEETNLPKNATWVKMTCWPANNKPGETGHQVHPYQSWVGTPAASVFYNDPDNKKWYVAYHDGGYGGPTDAAPYFIAVQLKHPYTLTHFTIASSGDKPERDPRVWAIQGSNTGKDGDWTDIYRCNAASRETSPLRVYPRSEVLLYTSFTSATMYTTVSAEDVKGLAAKLKGKKIDKADFVRPAKPYTWFRFMSPAAFNGNTMDISDATNPAGFSLGQVEFFGTTTDKVDPVVKKGGKSADGTKVATSRPAPKIVPPTTVDANELAALPAIGKGELRKVIYLDGEWDIAAGGMGEAPAQFASKVPVPGLSDLATPAVGGGQAFWYHKKFTVTGPLPDTAVLKVYRAMFGTQVTLNGKVIGEHVYNFTPGLFNAAGALKVGENDLLIRVGASLSPKPIQSGFDEEKRKYIAGIYDSVELILSGAPQILRVQAARPRAARSSARTTASLRPAAAPSGRA